MAKSDQDQCIVRRFSFFGDLEKSEFFHFSSSPNREAIPHFHTFTNFSFHHQIISFQAREIHRTCKEITSLKMTESLARLWVMRMARTSWTIPECRE
ncbi:unnamed protein product [Trifolium pratense]|uniref:Uncharacterized protein n=2 Tax=Trifolium pratense TaxID=57577 RepID=A0ACB0J2A4_TRIPR|nr:unnamed protein product [Trifolium pratense]CAJ2638256.1 unnamed protein product [Trifolium pratense]